MTFVSIFPSCFGTRMVTVRRLKESELMIGDRYCKRIATPESEDRPGRLAPYFIETKTNRASQEMRRSDATISHSRLKPIRMSARAIRKDRNEQGK